MKRKIAIGMMAIWLAGGVCASAATEELTFDQRVFYQERVERVYYNRRTGTLRQGSGQASLSFEQAVPREVMEAKVRKYLAQDAIVNGKVGQTLLSAMSFGKPQAGVPAPLSDEKLQKELERICRSTKAPETLRELFAALDNNAYLVKEILVRPILAEKMSRVLYQKDSSFHAPERELTEKILAELQITGGEMMEATARTYDAEYAKFILTAEDAENTEKKDLFSAPSAISAVKSSALSVSSAVISSRQSELAGTERAPKLSVTEDAYIVERLVEMRNLELTIESITVQKRPYESWLDLTAENAEHAEKKKNFNNSALSATSAVNSSASRFEELPVITSAEGDCTADSWEGTHVMGGGVSPRWYHTAVWTGTEMIIWGGNDGTHTNTGGRYDPATDSWTPTATVGAPTPRGGHVAVWTGTVMVVWGGINWDVEPYLLGTGGRYDPVEDSWTATSMMDAPEGRSNHTAVWTGAEMIVWGGVNAEFEYINTGGRYDPVEDLWVATAVDTDGVPSARFDPTAVWAGTVMIVWGGFDVGGSRVNTGGRYDPSTNTWAETSTTNGDGAPVARISHKAVWSGTVMIVWGGEDDDLNYLSTGGRYNPATDSWADTSSSGQLGRVGHTAVWTGTRMIFWGGASEPGVFRRTGGVYDPVGDTWTLTSLATGDGAPTARYQHTAVWTGTEMIVWGGWDGAYSNTGGRYDPAANSWRTPTTTDAPAAREEFTTVWTGTEMIVWGGYNGSYLNTGGRYDPATDWWAKTSTGTNVPSARERHTAVWTGTEMIVWGGGGSGGFTATGGRYNPLSNSWTVVPTTNGDGAPTARERHTAVWTGTEMIVWGGYDGVTPYFNTGGRYHPDADFWTATSTTDAPTARLGHTAIWTGTEMIVWGGWSGGLLNTGGRYDPEDNVQGSWIPTTTEGAPTARVGHTAVWTGTVMIVWGGDNGSGNLNTGERYDPEDNVQGSWTPTSTGTNVPSERRYHSAVWTGTEMIVWGGEGGGGELNTGGRYDLAADSWMATSTTGAPSARFGHTAVWAGETMIAWGGYDDSYTNTGGIYTPDCPSGGGSDPSAVPDGSTADSPLSVGLNGDGTLALTWSAACNASDYAVMAGDLSTLAGGYNHTSLVCTTGGLTSANVNAAGGNVYFLVVPHNAAIEGSYGRDSAVAERPAASLACYTQSVGSCP